MSADRLSTALRGLVDDVDAGLAPPLPDELWAGGRRRRRTARLVPAVAAACVAALVALVVWPSGGPQASVPAVTIDGNGYARLTSYPSAIPKPPFIPASARPGVTAAVLADRGDTLELYAVAPTGSVTRLGLPEATVSTPPSLSPDGRWLARGLQLTDLVRGGTVPDTRTRDGLSARRMPAQDAAWWSPDSRRVYVDAVNQGRPSSSGVVVGTDGTMAEAPLLEDGSVPTIAGWLDDSTVLALLPGDTDLGPTVLAMRTWTLGDRAWRDRGAQVVWTVEEPSAIRASLSPDGGRLLVTASAREPGSDRITGTYAMMFDPRTGAQLGMPSSSGGLEGTSVDDSVFWFGWGCRPAWRDGEPVVTDGEVRSTVVTADEAVVDVSSRYESPCVSFAGNDLRGTPTADARAVWQERVWVWGGRLLLVAGVAWVVRLLTRRRGWRDGVDSQRPPLPFLSSRG